MLARQSSLLTRQSSLLTCHVRHVRPQVLKGSNRTLAHLAPRLSAILGGRVRPAHSNLFELNRRVPSIFFYFNSRPYLGKLRPFKAGLHIFKTVSGQVASIRKLTAFPDPLAPHSPSRVVSGVFFGANFNHSGGN